MDSEDMPDLGAFMQDATVAGDAEDLFDEEDALETLLEDALEEEIEEEKREGEAEAEDGAKDMEMDGMKEERMPALGTGASEAKIADLALPDIVEQTFASLPRNPDGTINQRALDPDQARVFSGAVGTLLTEAQQDRYAAFRRSTLKEPLRRLMQVVLGLSVRVPPQDKTLLALSSVTKSFVGEVVEEARRVATERGDSGPLQPAHIYIAYQRLQERGLVETAPAPKLIRLRL